ncbi:DUF6883 domain-containing protein [Lapidilactobacillus luobeiensis]|uniref:DUF6883 domain-containing protein n=1 Tax=Lapidilactobacillus luobeiensis TaxID=2950371 RepID=UPI0021C294B6|nr:DUF6883 domain-containing protein [Lapidilactobacillus luobeiensis]
MKYNELDNWNMTKLDVLRRQLLVADPHLALPSADVATIASEKMTKYLFDLDNNRGIAKGILIAKRAGYDINNYPELIAEILKRADKYPVSLKRIDQYGGHYEQKIVLYGQKGQLSNMVVGWTVNEGKTWMATAYLEEV